MRQRAKQDILKKKPKEAFGMSVRMRTRCINSMTNWEVEEYLKRSDIVIVPVGTNERKKVFMHKQSDAAVHP